MENCPNYQHWHDGHVVNRWRTTVVQGTHSNEVYTSNGVRHDARILRGNPQYFSLHLLSLLNCYHLFDLAKLENLVPNTLSYI